MDSKLILILKISPNKYTNHVFFSQSNVPYCYPAEIAFGTTEVVVLGYHCAVLDLTAAARTCCLVLNIEASILRVIDEC